MIDEIMNDHLFPSLKGILTIVVPGMIVPIFPSGITTIGVPEMTVPTPLGVITNGVPEMKLPNII